MNILILFAHPALQRSRVNRHLITELSAMQNVTFHDLYEQYPDFYIDVEAEQKLLIAHDIIIMHHPFYWYSTPAILKEWQDLVLTHGWAYGQAGRALEGKVMFNAITTGAPEQAYTEAGLNHTTLKQLLTPLEHMASLCRMTYLPPFVVYGAHLMTSETMVQSRADYHQLLKAFTEDRVDLDRALKVERLNQDLDLLIKEGDNVR